MKRLTAVLAVAVMALSLWLPAAAMAEDAPEARPVLTAIEFKSATLNEEFSPYTNEYTLTLDDTAETPTLKNYTVEGDAEVFVNYTLDEAKHQTGITVTLEYESGTNVYSFAYANAQAYAVNGNNLLAQMNCMLGEVYPAINDKLTDYRLYIPSDLNVLQLSAVTQDIGAYCEIPQEIELGADREPVISATVIASDGTSRKYNFKIKRLKKTCDEVRAEMASPDFTTLVKGELFYQQPAFLVTAAAVLGAAILLAVFMRFARRLTVRPGDSEEPEFFAPAE